GWVATHPCVALATGGPLGGGCHAYGFPPREEGVAPPGSPASFAFEGDTGDGFLQLSHGQAVPGISGAPLVCPTRRAVVGVVIATRDRYSDLGGWASPVSALLAGGRGVPEQLVAHGQRVAAANTAAVLAGRAAWHAVLPVDGAEHTLDQPWATFVRKARSSPADLLRADYGVVPYLFRDADLAQAQAWCEQPSAMEVVRVAGRGGAGKTRYAIELCRRMGARGWVTGVWTGTGPDVATVPLPRLVVVDYAEATPAETLRTLLDRLRTHATLMAPVRVLLLTRTAAAGLTDVFDNVGRNASAALRTVLDSAGDAGAARTLGVEQREELYRTAVAEFGRAWHGDQDPPLAPARPALAGSQYLLPLGVLFEAFDGALSGGTPDTSRPPVDRVLDHEQRYWDATAPDDLPASLRRPVVGLATLAGAADDDQAHALLALLPDLAGEPSAALRRQTVRWLAGLYPGPGRLNPLRPDRLGEALVAELLTDPDHGGPALLAAVLTGLAPGQVAHGLDVLARLGATDTVVADMLARVLAANHQQLVPMAEAMARGTPDGPGHFALATELQRLLGGRLAERVEQMLPGGTGSARDLSISYNKLGDLAVQSGQGEQAQALYRQGLTIRERLAQAEPGNTTSARDLSVSYERLGDLAVQSGQGEQAQALYRQGLTIAERLAQAEPGNTT
ncbi:MAG TPA: tetratricopeptide repeat protein, partial [Micromonosporaceae bacterium]|nr:tetratricopeptide repeat protein [Micromonosporaceae bacterium]